MSICKNSEIPRSAYYRYFDSLEDSLSAVFENMEKDKIIRFRQMLMSRGRDFISNSINVLEEMLNDEETYLFMSTLSRDNTFDLPMFTNKRKMNFFNSNDEQLAIRNALMIVVKGFTEEFYALKKTKEECLKEYKILVNIMELGFKQYVIQNING